MGENATQYNLFRRNRPVQHTSILSAGTSPIFSIFIFKKRLGSGESTTSFFSWTGHTPLFPTQLYSFLPSLFSRPLSALQRPIPGRVLASSSGKKHRRPS